jgi:triacylglycerol esterase/lipase EstA (alpha/beta hydrolase family)
MPSLRRILIRTPLVLALVLVTDLLVPTGPAAAATAPRIAAAKRVAARLAGANNWSCRPSAQHPEPVILVHGTFASAAIAWPVLSPRLAANGYCVFALDYGNGGLNHVAQSAAQLKVFVDGVRAATGARRVDIVGHSQGGMMPRYYIRFLGGAAYVNDLVGIAPPNHGTTSDLAHVLGIGIFCPACVDQQAASPFMNQLNAGHDTEPGVDYTVVSTRYDLVVTPYQSQFLSGSRVTNVTLQSKCPIDIAGHVAMSLDVYVGAWVLNALGRPGPADPRFQPACVH